MGGIATQPLLLRGSQNKGTTSKVATSPLPSRGRARGLKCYVTPAFLGVPKQGDKIRNGYLTNAFSGAHKWVELLRNPCVLGDAQTRGQNQKWLLHPCLLGGAHLGGIATQPFRSRGFRNKGTKLAVATSTLPRERTSGRNCYVTPVFSGVPKQGDNIKSGYLSLAFSGAHKWVEILCNPCVLGGPQLGGSTTSPLRSRGFPNKGTTSKVATSPIPFRGRTSGRNCYVSPAFSRVPKQVDEIRSRGDTAIPPTCGAQRRQG